VISTARRALAYICTYFYLAQSNNIPSDAKTQQVAQQNKNIAQEQKLLFKQIESLSKQFCSHWCALDFDRGFVSSLFTVKKENIT